MSNEGFHLNEKRMSKINVKSSFCMLFEVFDPFNYSDMTNLTKYIITMKKKCKWIEIEPKYHKIQIYPKNHALSFSAIVATTFAKSN